MACVCLRLVYFFFFQAEDGIRDLVRSRGLGDVYKRQGQQREVQFGADAAGRQAGRCARRQPRRGGCGLCPVSYTHLTLPTSDLV